LTDLSTEIASFRGRHVNFPFRHDHVDRQWSASKNQEVALVRPRALGLSLGYFLPDMLGSSIAVADSAGAVQTEYTYESFGQSTVTGAFDTNPFSTLAGKKILPISIITEPDIISHSFNDFLAKILLFG